MRTTDFQRWFFSLPAAQKREARKRFRHRLAQLPRVQHPRLPDPCIILAGRDYPPANILGRSLGGHIAAVTLAGIAIPDGHYVAHLCDDPHCLQIRHLAPVPPRANTQQALDRGRLRVGEAHRAARLTAKTVRKIKLGIVQGYSLVRLARRHGVTYDAVYPIATGTNWRMIPFPSLADAMKHDPVGVLERRASRFADQLLRSHYRRKKPKFPAALVAEMRARMAAGETVNAIARAYRISTTHAIRIRQGTARRVA